jgi:hypothetical protein
LCVGYPAGNEPAAAPLGRSGSTLVRRVSLSMTRTWRLGTQDQPSWGHPVDATTTEVSVSR